jgi:hypothetical protein
MQTVESGILMDLDNSAELVLDLDPKKQLLGQNLSDSTLVFGDLALAAIKLPTIVIYDKNN